MKKILTLLAVIAFVVACNAQPNSSSTYEVGIVNPVIGKTYVFFKEVKTDTSTSRLLNNMDYLTPDNVSGLIQTLSNFHSSGDTTIGEFTLPDAVEKRYIKGGLIQRDNGTNKYSGMTVTFWMSLDQLEKRPGFFMRKKK